MLVFLNLVIVGVVWAVALSNQYFSAGRFVFTYDESMLAVDQVGGFVYDSMGKIDSFTIRVRNLNATTPYSGTMQVVVGDQQFDVNISALGAGSTRTYRIDLNPNLPSTAFAVDATIFMGASGTADLVALAATSIANASIDGAIGTEWDDAKRYSNFPLDPSGSATVWLKHDNVSLYLAVQFLADSSNPWFGVQLGTAGCMDAGDFVLLGDDNFASNGYIDSALSGSKSKGGVSSDATQDGVGSISVAANRTVTIEVKKPLNSGDTTGKDIAWTVGSTYTVVMAWDSDGGGSSGGNADHTGGSSPTARTIQLRA